MTMRKKKPVGTTIGESKFVRVMMSDVLAECTACGSIQNLSLSEGPSQTLEVSMPTCPCSPYFATKWKLVARHIEDVHT